ncbi:hypothetical protein K1719_040709 [Acacia pycnantha]|nr:hypothetical protein K1719_040709 [Acacia pycnantha]
MKRSKTKKEEETNQQLCIFLTGAEIFNCYNCMRNDKFAPSFYLYPCAYIQTRVPEDKGESIIHWGYAERMQETSSSAKANSFLGPFFLIVSALVWAAWFVVQADLAKHFPAPYTSTAYMCLLASFQCVVIALCFDHSASTLVPHKSYPSHFCSLFGSSLHRSGVFDHVVDY